MLFFLLLYLVSSDTFVIKAYYTKKPPKIDGYIENIWTEGDSITQFIQLEPDEGKPATEPTTVYILYDDEALYVAFKCITPRREPDIRVTTRDWTDGDEVSLYLDTFGDRRTAYQFSISAAGVQGDAFITEDGRNRDFSWEGIWFSSVTSCSIGYYVEIKIPFKSIQYKVGLKEWGINFKRYIPPRDEVAYWAPMRINEGLRVSRFGILEDINPGMRGRNLEIFPVSLLRHDKGYEKEETKPDLGIDLNWGLSSSYSLQVTLNPDFAQIEADPTKVNLSKYELYFPERRPFFVEGASTFKPSGVGENGFYNPLSIFYSRRIGKRLPDGSEVPFSVGFKLIGKGTGWELGVLGARTERAIYESSGELMEEPLSYYSVVRFLRQILGNSTLGFLYASKTESGGGTNRALSFDATLRTSEFQWALQTALSDRDGKGDFAMVSGFLWSSRKFVVLGSATSIGENFDVSQIGFVPEVGHKRYMIFGGPSFYPESGLFRTASFGIGVGRGKEGGENAWYKGSALNLNVQLRNNWGANLNISMGKDFEKDKYYWSKNYNLSFWSDWSKPLSGNFWFWKGYGYNYRREYFAFMGNFGGFIRYLFTKRLRISISLSGWLEWNPEGLWEEQTWVLRPRIQYALTKDLIVRLYTEHVLSIPKALVSKREWSSHRIGFLLSYNFRPKSWIYIALNDLENFEDGNYIQMERIFVFKVRYLFYF